jgi:Leucine-rich repeat (LRR) protein
MFRVYFSGLSILIILAMASMTFAHCPPEKRRSPGNCTFQIYCRGSIRDVSLPTECQGSTNYPVSIDLFLSEAVERFDEHAADAEFLMSITSLRVSGVWKQTNLSMLEYMPRLRRLILIEDHIEEIIGTPFYQLSRLEILDLSYNNLTNIEELFQFESFPNKMSKLSLAHNAINEIPGDAFGELSSLTELDLSHNLISDLTEEPFNNLTALETLKLNNNRIKDLNGAVNNLQNLKHMFLSGNQIQNINVESLKIIYDLETFDISLNQLKSVKPTVFSRHWQHFATNSVCKIILSQNQITSVPNATSKEMFDRYTRSPRGRSFKNMDVTTELDLSKNQISIIEYDAFQPLIRLVSLDLSVNRITDFIVNPRDLVNVKYLNLNTNNIHNLYFDSFISMKNLQNLDLSNNHLENIPDRTFMNKYNLKHVNMTYNDIKMLQNLRIKMFHPEGGVLDLSNNNISRFNIPFGEGLRLTMLDLHSNNIYDISSIQLQYQNELEILDLSNNEIKELYETSLRLPFTLSTLYLNSNAISYIGPAAFLTVGHLKTLHLKHNNLTKIEYGTFQGLTVLMNLDLSFNHILYLDSIVMMDLKSLKVLSLRYNGLQSLEYKNWLGHKFELKVYLEGNNITCEWLGAALSDFNNGYSRMMPTVLVRSIVGESLEGIPCINENDMMKNGKLSRLTAYEAMTDERLLVIARNILEAIKEQNHYMRRYVWGLKNVDQK